MKKCMIIELAACAVVIAGVILPLCAEEVAPDGAAHGALCAQTAGQFPVSDNVRGHENTEWSQSYAYHLTDAKKDLPRVLLVGDSICRAYADGVGRILDGKMNVTFWVSSYCVTSPNYLRLLSVMLDEAKYDVVHFNNTLHSLQTKTADWERAFEAALALVRKKQPEAKLVWCAGTPLRNAAKTRKAAELNEAGARVVAKLGGIVTNDLFRLLDPLDRKSAWRDDYHFTAGTSADIARRVADCVLEAAGLAPRCVSVGTAAGVVRFSSPSPGAIRVTRGHEMKKELVLVSPKPAGLSSERGEGWTKVSSGNLAAVVDARTGHVRFERGGKTILSEQDVGAKTVAFDSPASERLYGLGQFQDGMLNVRNLPRRLVQVNTQVAVPFLVSTRGWGLYWHTYAKVEFNPCTKVVALTRKEGPSKSETVNVSDDSGGKKETRSQVEWTGTLDVADGGEYAFMLDCGAKMARQQIVEIDGVRVVENRNLWLPPAVGFLRRLAPGRHEIKVLAESRDKPSLAYRADVCATRFETDSPVSGTDYIVYGGAPDEAIAQFRSDTGGTAALPDWAWGYWHCQERYKSQEQLLDAVEWFKSRDLPLAVIVQDWLWWPKGTWNPLVWDSARYPDPKAMAEKCRENGTRTMLSVWSRTKGKSRLKAELDAIGGFVRGTEWIDFSNPAAADVYWKHFETCCVQKGIDAFWLDAVEPENDDLAGRKLKIGSGDVYRNIYPLLVNDEADRRLRALRPSEPPLVLTRCAFAGQWRDACVVWSGDVGSGWDDFRKQVIAGLGFAMAGFPYWTSDCGGFFRPSDQYTNKTYHKIYSRWMAFATFCPIQRVHGYKSDTTPSRFGPEIEKRMTEQIRLRERLKPYLKRTAEEVVKSNAMFMRPLWEAPEGFETEYMLGRDILVCPVTSDAEEIDVWLPPGGWTALDSGKEETGPKVIRAKAPIDRIPVYVRSQAQDVLKELLD